MFTCPPPVRNASQREFPILRNSGIRKPELGSGRVALAYVFSSSINLWNEFIYVSEIYKLLLYAYFLCRDLILIRAGDVSEKQYLKKF
jgi:hypothetical protein